ncbi:hypothetical protein [Candidatus Nitrosotalea sp. TS]|uniref:hypothetical protein n=1 Tax=Candidatus Nitrosotalea sp. TS TaxID=2341020 RepID=UPI00140B0130|nr:hypothetical protein [Candidatus Nitrosotalea sp. TS]
MLAINTMTDATTFPTSFLWCSMLKRPLIESITTVTCDVLALTSISVNISPIVSSEGRYKVRLSCAGIIPDTTYPLYNKSRSRYSTLVFASLTSFDIKPAFTKGSEYKTELICVCERMSFSFGVGLSDSSP